MSDQKLETATMKLAVEDAAQNAPARRILIVDDNPAIHEDIKKILRPRGSGPLGALEADLFGAEPTPTVAEPMLGFELQSAFQGQQAVALVEHAVAAGTPFGVAFVDMRMPPGWDGIETIQRIRQVDPNIQIVICSAHSDYSWGAIYERLKPTDWLLILRKPFERIEVQQLASTLTEKRILAARAAVNIEALEDLVQRHARTLQDVNAELARRNAELSQVNERLSSEIAARQLADERIRHIAFHDALTDLPNRAFLMERLQECIDRSKRHSEYRFAVLFMDVDNFKYVNDTLGHRAGDHFLSQLAATMTSVMRTMQPAIRPSYDTVARLGGDEFVILLDDVGKEENALLVAQRIQQAASAPITVGHRQLTASVSIGAALSQNNYDDPADVMRDADTALYNAKAEGKGRISLFDQAMRARMLQRADVESDLRLAIARREFVIYYQPIVSLVTGRICCLEALVRWQHPRRGLLPPDAFLPVAEQTGLMEAIGEQVFEEVASQLAAWRASSTEAAHVSVSVNLSAAQLVSERLLEQVDRCIDWHGLDPDALKIELTETTAMHNVEQSRRVIGELLARGVEVYLDDFGTGYSSLSTLHSLPFAAIKLDKSFMANITTDAESETTLRAIMMIADNRNMRLIVEGI
ncbi:MAG: hypothetical protein DCC67_14335, partial [Planctomycetota bacterium]